MEIEKLSNGIKNIAWGYLFLHLDLNIGAMDVLPDWVGYLFILSALPAIAEAEESATLLRPLAILLAIWQGVIWVTTLLGVEFDGRILSTLEGILDLYFHFQLLTNLSAIAYKFQCPQWKKILTLRTIRTILTAFFILVQPVMTDLSFDSNFSVLIIYILLLLFVIVVLWICKVLFSLNNSLLSSKSDVEY